ncbi:hypothetical protein FRC09_001782 [Ceratobasidium sp. 395]|nr:hypothetical protein FRC09_001782 [Ceratobasidium sp. 395]
MPLRAESIQDVVAGYTLLPRQSPRIQLQMLDNEIRNLDSYIRSMLNPASVRTSSGRLSHSHRNTNRSSDRSIENDLTEAKEKSQYLELALNELEAEAKHLRDQLEQTRSEYASLRSELQLNDNMEQSRIVQSLKDLNRCIEDLGRSIAEHIVDSYIPGYANDETTLKAVNLSQIKAQFYHHEGRHSLVVSSNGDGMPTEDFFDLAVRSILCKFLYENIFLPFHPTLLGDPRNEFMNELYREVRSQNHQTTASKWRASSFLAFSKDSATVRDQHVRGYVENIKTQDLATLFVGFFGEKVNILLTDSHDREIERLVGLAWDWNYTLKGSVIMLGDYQPTIYDSGVPFDPTCMANFEPKKGLKEAPDTALCTIGLGLTTSCSRTGGNVLGSAVVCKAPVVTEHIYDED